MKKILLAVMLLCTSASVVTMQSCSTSSVLSSSNAGAIAKSLLPLLTSKLGLSSAQSPVVSQLLSSFLTNKSNILGLLKTNPASYASKFSNLQGTLMTGLKGVLDTKQMGSLSSLRPTTNDAKNILSNLFY